MPRPSIATCSPSSAAERSDRTGVPCAGAAPRSIHRDTPSTPVNACPPLAALQSPRSACPSAARIHGVLRTSDASGGLCDRGRAKLEWKVRAWLHPRGLHPDRLRSSPPRASGQAAGPTHRHGRDRGGSRPRQSSPRRLARRRRLARHAVQPWQGTLVLGVLRARIVRGYSIAVRTPPVCQWLRLCAWIMGVESQAYLQCWTSRAESWRDNAAPGLLLLAMPTLRSLDAPD